VTDLAVHADTIPVNALPALAGKPRTSSSDNLPVGDRLAKLTATAVTWHHAVGQALGDALRHAMAAGDALIAMRELVPEGQWQAYLRDRTDISERSARVYMQVARDRAKLGSGRRSAGPLSIAAALQLLKDPSKAPRKTKSKSGVIAKLDLLAWSTANLVDRRHFLDGVGLAGLLEAVPPEWRAELERRVIGGIKSRCRSEADKAAIRKIEKLIKEPTLLTLQAENPPALLTQQAEGPA
jgi:hypothetical protein